MIGHRKQAHGIIFFQEIHPIMIRSDPHFLKKHCQKPTASANIHELRVPLLRLPRQQ